MRGLVLTAVAVLVSLALVGCGAAAAPVPHVTSVSVTVPVDGATVATRNIEVVGAVLPQAARVRVAGRGIRVRAGAFKARMRLHAGVNRIRVFASARGYGHARTELTVRYRANAPVRRAAPGLAAQVNAACSNLDVKLVVMAPASDPTTYVSEARKLLPLQRRLVSRLEAIKAPPAARTAYAAFVSSFDLVVSDDAQVLQDLQTNAVAGLPGLVAQAKPASASFLAHGHRLGFYACTEFVVPLG
jgi:hypothetical protein